MDLLPNSPESIWKLGIVLIIAIGAYLTTSRSSIPVLRRLSLRGRRDSTAKTPPRSLSPDNKRSTSPPESYSHVLPPHRRESLLQLQAHCFRWRNVTEAEVRQNILPMTADYMTSPGNLYTPTGFTVEQVKTLGDFPDYATLCGVPLPNPYPEHNIEKALPRPFRPFRWTYHQTMSLTKLETDWWIELENTYKSRIAQRKALYAKHGKAVLDALPGSELACKELMEMVLQFVCARYPQYFSVVDKRILQNRILETEQDIRSKPPLEILIDNIPEDFAIMLRDDQTGYYFMRAGVICSALGWNVGSKIGKQLHEIHAPIPDYKEKMQFSMDRFFTKMPTDKPIQRGSWGLECNLRVDWQTLRRLPISAGVVFNFKALFTPVSEFRDEPGVPALIAKVLKEGKESLMRYKGTWHVQHVILPKLEEWTKEQEDLGIMPKGWEVTTLDESPWFRNWEEKWHRQQGF
ncbi:hypothetical protein N7468_008168 [Penicillium chermesinum]|uniref:HRQ family protein n=1 Tax=Penicillium chermesinum TaxID=63820 RepID=A0A9W9TI43_9EURO|nr:uncharacterized protein N7468_008168 [Penicillium chermesinum]KAJ5223626.1 hypothetical protein N7468_008168 [Penicillium chermesinum]